MVAESSMIRILRPLCVSRFLRRLSVGPALATSALVVATSLLFRMDLICLKMLMPLYFSSPMIVDCPDFFFVASISESAG